MIIEQLVMWPEAILQSELRPITGGRRYLRERRSGRPVQLVIASESPAKRAVLKSLGLRFIAAPSHVDEWEVEATTANELVLELGLRKALAVAHDFPGAVILGADTVIDADGRVIGKPRDKRDAAEILRTLSGKVHQVVTGITAIEAATGRRASRLAETNVHFRSLDPATIRRYVESKEPLGKAGAYALQSLGAALVRHIDGDPHNVTGLPVSALTDVLDTLGYDIL